VPDLKNKNIVYNGIIPTSKYGDVEIDFLFDDDAFIDFPKAIIGINSQCKFRPYHFPHLDNSWSLCYHDGSKIFDRYNPGEIVQFCMKNTTDVLNNAIEDDMSEIKREFSSYWRGNTSHCYSFLLPNDIVAYKQGNWLVSPTIRFKMGDGSNEEVPIFKLANIPSIANIDWPIENYSDFQEWINKESPEIENDIKKYLREMIQRKKIKTRFIIFIAGLNIYLGVLIEFKSPALNIKAKNWRQETINSIFKGNHIFHRFTIENYTNEEIIKANISQNDYTLIDKNILLIGLGTIGSNLAGLLVKNGSGIGENASFTIADDDIYKPYNFSRHFLGIKSAGYKKACSLEVLLEDSFPGVKIKAFDKSVQDLDFDHYDIIIDSTGEESLTQYLNERIIMNDLCKLFVSTWIRGQGLAAECIAIPNNKGACHECLRKSEHYGIIDSTSLSLRGSCNSIYIPFPITASMYAVLLTISVINKWFKGELTETTFFSQKLIPVGDIKEMIIAKRIGCPACGMN
jgi:molybdopterin/thiamine biosynthesis adenylyltransferase